MKTFGRRWAEILSSSPQFNFKGCFEDAHTRLTLFFSPPQLHNAANTNQKEKYEADLKKEIKKLQVSEPSSTALLLVGSRSGQGVLSSTGPAWLVSTRVRLSR